MAGRSWREVSEALKLITPVCAKHDADGVDIYFLNRRDSDMYKNVTAASTVVEIFQTVQPGGGTPTGQKLNSILKPYLRKYEAHPETTKPKMSSHHEGLSSWLQDLVAEPATPLSFLRPPYDGQCIHREMFHAIEQAALVALHDTASLTLWVYRPRVISLPHTDPDFQKEHLYICLDQSTEADPEARVRFGNAVVQHLRGTQGALLESANFWGRKTLDEATATGYHGVVPARFAYSHGQSESLQTEHGMEHGVNIEVFSHIVAPSGVQSPSPDLSVLPGAAESAVHMLVRSQSRQYKVLGEVGPSEPPIVSNEGGHSWMKKLGIVR